MIYTVTLNPSVDYHVWIPSLSEGTIHQVQKEWKDAGGKGINVSKVLHNLGTESTVLGFVGGFTGEYIQRQVEQAGIPHHLIRVEQDSRINLKIKAQTETDISGVAPAISEAALNGLLEQIERLSATDCLVLAGSVPDSVPADIYQFILQRMLKKGVPVLLDTKGEALANALSEKPFLIKPNHHELGELFGVTITTAEDAVHYGRRTVELGAVNAIVSMAGQGAVFVNQQAAYVAQFPECKAVNSIGAGDSMVAGFLHAMSRGNDLSEAFRFAVAAGSATAVSEGFCTLEKIEAFLPQITITQVG